MVTFSRVPRLSRCASRKSEGHILISYQFLNMKEMNIDSIATKSMKNRIGYFD